MFLKSQKSFLYLVIAYICFSYGTAVALDLRPNVGFGTEYTDNSTKSPDEIVNELETIGVVGFVLEENRGPLQYNFDGSLSKHQYTKNTFEDENYINFNAKADWEAITKRLHFTFSDKRTQKSITALDALTPENTQDTNVLKFSVGMLFPISARQSFNITPSYTTYYYEETDTDNNQFAVNAAWDYQLFRLTNVKINLNLREVEYTELDALGGITPDASYSSLNAAANIDRGKSQYTFNLGVTNVDVDGKRSSNGVIGGASWQVDVSSRSTFEARASSKITDTSTISLEAEGGDGDDVVIVADVVRNSYVFVSYNRKDVDLHSRIWAELRKTKYDNNVIEQAVRSTGVELNFPGTPLFSSNISAIFKQAERLDSGRVDDNFVVAGGFLYKLSRKLQGEFKLKYDTKESTEQLQNYNELRIFFGLTYGYDDLKL